MDKKVDYIFPYVDSSDPNWQKMASAYFPNKTWKPQRFRELGFLKYLFRGFAENMPWLHNIIMLVDFKSQIPKWLKLENTNIRVVTLDEFVPKKYLPTFNSNTIEMFLANIPDLSEYLIYGNDDFIPLSKSEITDYFTDEGLPRISYKLKDSARTAFRKQCKRNWDIVAAHFPDINLGKGKFYEQLHCPQPITLSLLKEASEVLEKERINSITRKRDFNGKNLSQYIYFNYTIVSRKCEKKNGDYVYKDLTVNNLKSIIKEIECSKNKWICLNDSAKTKLSIIKDIIKELEEKFPDKCTYEK